MGANGQVMQQLHKTGTKWWGVALMPMITHNREFHIIHKLYSFPVRTLSEAHQASNGV